MSAIVIMGLFVFFVMGRFVLKALGEFVKHHGLHWLVFRALVLRPLHGKKKSDATFWRGSSDRASGKSSGRHHRAGIVNLGITLAVLGLVCSVGYGLLVDRTLTEVLTVLTVAAGIVLGSVLGVRAARRARRNRHVVRPLAVAAEAIIDPDGSLGTRLGSMITMERDWQTIKRGPIGKMIVPDDFHANEGQRTQLEALISSRLPVPVKFRWQTVKSPFSVTILASPAMPRTVPFRRYVDQLEALGPDEFGVGVDGDGEVYVADHGGDTPWHARCAGSGTGKSTGFQIKTAQILHKDPDAEVHAFDTKQISFEPLRGVPRLTIYNDMADIWSAWYRLAGIMDQRYRDMKADPTAIDRMNNIWIEVDEGNDMAVQLVGHYRANVRQPGEPNQPPIWLEAIAPILWKGRQVKIRGEFMLQNMLERYLGGLSLRPSFGVIGMAGYKPNQWKTIIGTTPVPKLQTGPGRICMVRGAEETWVQGFFDLPDFIRDYATLAPEPVAPVIPLQREPEQIEQDA
jgi:hypothetical protein